MADALHTPGVVDARDARLDDAGLITPQGSSSLDVRTGVLYGPGTLTLVKGTTASAPMTVTIDPHHWVTSRGAAFGPYRGTNETVRTVPVAAAPAANSRIDVVYVKMQDNTAGIPSPDGSAGELYGVQTGTAAVTPAKPTIPVGAEELATVTIAAGATSTSGAGVTISNTARQTALRGTPIPVRNQAERDALTPYPDLEVRRLGVTGNPVERWNGAAWVRDLRGPTLAGSDTGVGGLTAPPGPVTMHPGRTIDPAALFGPGVGALVHIDARTLGDCPDGQWNLELVSPALSATVLTGDSRDFAGRNTLVVTDTIVIPAGTTRSFSTRLAGGSGSITTYTDPTVNRAKYTVHPYL